MRLVLLGLPGAGKGTQAERISRRFGIPHISTGSIIREVIASGSPLGEEVNSYISRGNLIPDSIAIEIVRERLLEGDCVRGWILDGFPRTVAQAEHLDSVLTKDGIAVDLALDVRISEDEAIRRIEQRRMCKQCGTAYHLLYYRPRVEGVCDVCEGLLYQRTDDNRETAHQRLRVYVKQTHPVVHYYAQSGRLVSVDGNRTIDDVFFDVDAAFSSYYGEEMLGDVQ